jgi:hypothetical protein
VPQAATSGPDEVLALAVDPQPTVLTGGEDGSDRAPGR